MTILSVGRMTRKCSHWMGLPMIASPPSPTPNRGSSGWNEARIGRVGLSRNPMCNWQRSCAQGHIREARKVAYEAEKHSRRHENQQLQVIPNGDVLVGLRSIWRDLKRAWLWGWSWILRLTIGYGLYPMRSIAALTLLIGVAWGLSHLTWTQGGMVPNSGPVLVSGGWLNVADTQHAAETWSKTNPGKDWETFNGAAWAADLVIPIVDLGQTSAWAPSTERGPWGKRLWWARWILITFGWIVSALGAAAITGIIRRE